MSGRSWSTSGSAALLVVLALLVWSGCSRSGAGSGDASQSPPPVLKKIVPMPDSRPPRQFVQDGMLSCAWVVLPRKGGFVLVIRRDVMGNGSGAVLEGGLVPWSAVVPCQKPEALSSGIPVRAGTDREAFHALVSTVKGSMVTLTRMWRFKPRTVTVPLEQVWPLKHTIEPLQTVYYMREGRWFRGTILNVSSGTMWVLRDNGGILDTLPVSTRVYYPPLGPVARGTRVLALRSWGSNLKPGFVEKVLVPGLMYTIRFSNVRRDVPYWSIALENQ